MLLFFLLLSAVLSSPSSSHDATWSGEVVTFRSGELTLHGVLYRPEGAGPFPAVVYNHGSAPGMLGKEAFDVLGQCLRRTAGCSSDRTEGAKV